MSDDFLFDRSGDILTITINHPERGNAMSEAMIAELGDVIEQEHDSLRLIVLRGAGDNFCVGRASMTTPKPALQEAYALRAASDVVFRCYGLIRRSNAPVLAVVQGRAAGFGYALAAAADITIAAETASFSIPEFNHNIMPTMVMSSMIDRVPLKALMYNVWSCQELSPSRAMAIGTVSEVVPAADLGKTVDAFIERLVRAPLPAVLAVKEYGVHAQPIDMPKAVHFARSLHAMVNASGEMKRK